MKCRGCGSTNARSGGNKYDLCRACWKEVGIFCGARLDLRRGDSVLREITADRVAEWLVHRIEIDSNKTTKGKVLGRCEAMNLVGYQCAKPARYERDGKKLCVHHG